MVTSLAKPDPKREARGSGDKPILRFVLPAKILQSNQIAERLIKIPIPRKPARRYGFGLRVQVSFDTRSEREAARSAARELSYLDFKPEQLKVVLTFVKGRDVFAVLNNIHYSILHLCITLMLHRATVQYYPVLHGQIRMRS